MWRPNPWSILLLLLTIVIAVVAWRTSSWRFAETELPEPSVVFDLVQRIPDKRESPENPLFTNFRCNMMPRVGQQITVEGVFSGVKMDSSIRYDGWQINIRPTSEADFARYVELDRAFDGHTVRAIGTLRYFPPVTTMRPDGMPVQNMPEHFYFAPGDVVVTDLGMAPAN